MGKAARKKVLKELNWPKIAEQVLDVFEMVMPNE
jgi:hypothetical protein